MSAEEYIAWIDVETTGLDPQRNTLLQVACIITDTDLNELDEGFEAKIFHSSAFTSILRKNATPFVQNMHDENGLWESLPSGVDLLDVQSGLIDYMKTHIPQAGTARLAGNSITLDRNFLEMYMPTALSYLSYRSYDMSTVSGLFDLYVPEVPWPQKKKTHDALDDIRESISEGRYYIEHLKAYSQLLKEKGDLG